MPTAAKVPYLGKDFLIKMGDGAASETFTTIGGFRTNSLKINQGEIDVTDKDGTRWRRLIAGGIRSIDISGAGVFSDDPVLAAALYRILNTDGGYKGNFKIVFGNGMSFTGSFFLKAMSFDGPHDKEETYNIELSSADDITCLLPAPTVTTVSPATGVAAGGAAVTLTGTGFQAGATVKFGTTAAASVVVVDGTTITCVSPAHTAGAVDVVVTNPDLQLGTATAAFTYT